MVGSNKAFSPMAILLSPALFDRAFTPTAMLCCPSSFALNAPYPTAVLFRFPVVVGAAFGLVSAELDVPMVVFPLASLTQGPLNAPKFNAMLVI
jgi:hypothetical protein